MGRGPDSTPQVLKWFREHIGVTAHYADIAAEIDMHPVVANKSCTNLVSRHPEIGVRRMGSGLYCYTPGVADQPTPETGDVYEHVGTMKDGTVVIRHTDTGQLGTWTPL